MNIRINLPALNDKDLSEINRTFPALSPNQNHLQPILRLEQTDRVVENQSFIKKRRKNRNELKGLLLKQKTNALVKQFIGKIKRLTPHHSIQPNLPIEGQKQLSKIDYVKQILQNTEGIKLSILFHIIWSIIMLIKTLFSVFAVSIILMFPETRANLTINNIIHLCIMLGIVDIILLSVTQKLQNSYELKNLKQILLYYLKQDFIIDCITIGLLITVLNTYSILIEILCTIVTIVKFMSTISRTQKLQNFYLTNIFQQKYYTIVKAMIFNFIIAHILATILVLMSRINRQDNWMKTMNIQHRDWTARYIWSCYWGVNIMLTVGFGDISAQNQAQALILVFVQTVSCIMLAYNINTVGSVLLDIKAKQSKRKKQLKVFYKMSAENKLQNEIKKQIMSSINESFEIKQKFMYDQYDNIINSLPPTVSKLYKKQSNKHLFNNIPFVNILSQKTILKLAEKIQRKIAHPYETIIKRGEDCKFTILNKGKLNYISRCRGSKIDGTVIQSILIGTNQSPKLLSLQFIKSNQEKFDIESEGYSVLYSLSRQSFSDCTKQQKRDFQIFCQWRDKYEFGLNYNQIYDCEYCPTEKHNLYSCPKIHYTPLRMFVILKNSKSKKNLSKRLLISRTKIVYRPLKNYKQIEQQYRHLGQDQNMQLSLFRQTCKNLKSFRSLRMKSLKDFKMRSEKQFNFKDQKVICYATVKTAIKDKRQAKQQNKSKQSQFTGQHNNSYKNNLYDIEKIKEQIKQVLKIDSYENGFWSLQIDKCYNFSYYMKQNNASKLFNRQLF